MGNLTVKQIDNSKPKTNAYKLIDGDGLQLRVAKDGTKTWLVRYMIDRKERQYRLPEDYGEGPGRIGLKDARDAATEIRALARRGIDIQNKLAQERADDLQRQVADAAQAKTLNDLFEKWIDSVDRKDEGKELRRSFGRDVLPVVGELRLSDLNPEHVEKILRSVVARGSNRIAVTLFADLKQMFRWGARKQAWKSLFENPTDEIEFKKILPKDYKGTERNRTLSTGEIQELAEKMPAAGLMPNSQLAMWIMLSCCCRIGEIIQSKWDNVDLQTGTWVIPEDLSKNGKEHTIFLSSFALSRFQELKRVSKSHTWCFPDTTGKTHVCIKSTTKQIRDRQLLALGRKPMKNRTKNADALLLANGDWVPHDLRRTGATIMQSLGISPAIIERVLNHIEPSKLIRTYQTYDYAVEKRDAWDRLGGTLETLLPQLAIPVVPE